jgi:membrane-associated phospholipid phosphatase
LEGWVTPVRLEVLAFAYAVFIPYVYLSILVGLLGRPERERDEFFDGLALLYAMSFLGYLFVPARGPVVELAGRFQAPLDGGFFHQTVVDAVAQCGGPHGAFPSLHVAVSLYVCAFDLRYNRLRGLVYLPIVALIAVATVALRYHWVVDLAAGALLTWAASRRRTRR